MTVIGCQGQVWETRPSGTKPSLYAYDENGAFLPGASSESQPSTWEAKFLPCEKDPLSGRCVGSVPYHINKQRRGLRGLQTADDVYTVVLFGDGASVSQDARDIFQQAVDFWNRAIAANGLLPFQVVFNTLGVPGRVADINYGLFCGIDAAEETFTLRGADATKSSQLVIVARVQGIDGRGGTLAQAGPCVLGPDVFQGIQTYAGQMTFDEVDFEAQLAADRTGLLNTVKHEMGHVFGIGTAWRLKNLIIDPVAANPNNVPKYVGQQGINGSGLVGVNGNVLVENNNGPGTADAHWEESVYRNELMTGFLNQGNNPASIMTIKSMLDLGLVVNECAAEDFRNAVTDREKCRNFFNPNRPEDPDNNNTGDPFIPSAVVEEPGLSAGDIAGITIASLLAVVGAAGVILFRSTSEETSQAQPIRVQHSPFDAEGSYGGAQQNYGNRSHNPRYTPKYANKYLSYGNP